MEDESGDDRYMDSQSFNAIFMLVLAQAKFPPLVIKPGVFYCYWFSLLLAGRSGDFHTTPFIL